MKFTIDEVDYHVTWIHDPNFESDLSKGRTTCNINASNCNWSSSEDAFCSKKDVFCKKIGRKVSFGKAVKNLIRRDIRRKLWAAYFEKWPLK